MANQIDNKLVLSPKLMSLCKWKKIDEVNAKLDSGESPNQVFKFINKNNFTISCPLVYEYAKIRKKCLVDGINLEHMVGIATRNLMDTSKPDTRSSIQKLKSEIDALDLLIQGGYNTLQEWSDRPVSPKNMMDAIKLKNALTDGNHGFLTNYGMEELRAMETEKYDLIIKHLLSYIPQDKQKEAIDKIDVIEDSYYQSTQYYEEYLRSRGDLTEEEIQNKVQIAYSIKEEQ